MEKCWHNVCFLRLWVYFFAFSVAFSYLEYLNYGKKLLNDSLKKEFQGNAAKKQDVILKYSLWTAKEDKKMSHSSSPISLELASQTHSK